MHIPCMYVCMYVCKYVCMYAYTKPTYMYDRGSQAHRTCILPDEVHINKELSMHKSAAVDTQMRSKQPDRAGQCPVCTW